MSDLQARFDEAAGAAQQLRQRPDNDTLLKLYALYKQATKGDISGRRPGMFDPVGRAKYDAWKKLKGTSQEEAQQAYIDLVEELQNK